MSPDTKPKQRGSTKRFQRCFFSSLWCAVANLPSSSVASLHPFLCTVWGHPPALSVLSLPQQNLACFSPFTYCGMSYDQSPIEGSVAIPHYGLLHESLVRCSCDEHAYTTGSMVDHCRGDLYAISDAACRLVERRAAWGGIPRGAAVGRFRSRRRGIH
jgi:hypothetical protein